MLVEVVEVYIVLVALMELEELEEVGVEQAVSLEWKLEPLTREVVQVDEEAMMVMV